MAQVSGNNNSNKHAQLNTSTSSKRQLPKALACSFIKGHIATFQTEIANLLKTLSTQHVDLLSRAFQQ
eukprot:5646196-Ditylum_brightwellii.AAC.1